jgi:hypothetical protein
VPQHLICELVLIHRFPCVRDAIYHIRAVHEYNCKLTSSKAMQPQQPSCICCVNSLYTFVSRRAAAGGRNERDNTEACHLHLLLLPLGMGGRCHPGRSTCQPRFWLCVVVVPCRAMIWLIEQSRERAWWLL